MSESESRGTDVLQDTFIINEIQLLLSEKRTSLSMLRTGIAIFAFPLSVLSVLIATSRYYEPKDVLPFLIPLALINAPGALLCVELANIAASWSGSARPVSPPTVSITW